MLRNGVAVVDEFLDRLHAAGVIIDGRLATFSTMCFMGESATTGSLPHTVYASARDKLENPVGATGQP